MVTIASNEFWGKRFGSVYKDGTLAFKIPSGGKVTNKHSGPSGKRGKRWYAGRFLKKKIAGKKPTAVKKR